MKRKPIAIKKKDSFRVLLTELLPYELPIFFSNQKLYEFCREKPAKTPPIVAKILGLSDARKYTVPFNYKIERGDGRRRTLSVMHPASQLKFVGFYEAWDAYILNQCSKSDFSLRYPIHVGSVFFEPDLQEEEPHMGDEAGDLAPGSTKEQRTHASSYFYYAKYNQVWKFYDSTEFRRIEQNFRSLLRLDVSKCFQNIYTHSISWAVRNKSFAKKNKEAVSFDKSFDSLMQGANWNETNGILVGPEVSRIFAEIILQQIDDDVKKELIEAGVYPRDVCVRRYVDDYLVFFNSENVAHIAKAKIEAALEKYKLSINEAKTETLISPLISSLSIARDFIRELLRERVSKLFEWKSEEDEIEDKVHSRTPSERSADYLIRALKGVIKTHGASYSTISPYSLGVISRVVNRSLKRLTKVDVDLQDPHNLYMTLSYVLEVSFFLYRMDVRVNTTYRITSILIAITEIADKFGSVGKIIRQEIVDHGASVLKQAQQAAIGDCEISSLLACLFYIGGEDAVPEDELIEALRLRGECESTAYFQIVTAFFCAQNKEKYAAVRAYACNIAKRFFENFKDDIYLDAEAVLLFFDLVSCPFADNATKDVAINAMARSLKYKELSVGDANYLKKFIANHLGFCDWSASGELPALLRRKELKPAYD